MTMLLFILVLGPEGPVVGNGGNPVAQVIDVDTCEAMGAAFSGRLTMTEEAIRRGLVFQHRCVPTGAGV
jgi:hypothetical protein